MQRILVIGSPGAGKSYLSSVLAKKLDLPLYHLDQMFWRKGWIEEGRDILVERVNKILPQKRWVIDGMYRSTLEMRLKHADTLIFLDYSYLRCVYGVLRRIVTNHGRVRPDMAEGCPERFDMNFMQYIRTFHKEHRHLVTEIIEPYKESDAVNVLIFKNPKETEQWLKTIV